MSSLVDFDAVSSSRGRRVRLGMQADPALNEAIAELRSRYRTVYGGRCRSQYLCVATVQSVAASEITNKSR